MTQTATQALSQLAVLRGITLASIKAGLEEPPSGEGQVKPFVAADARLDIHADGVMIAAVTFATGLNEILPNEGGPGRSVVTIQAVYFVTYLFPEEHRPIVEEAGDHFAKQIGVFNAWPFFRELAHSMSSRMGMVPLLLPLLSLPVVPPPAHGKPVEVVCQPRP